MKRGHKGREEREKKIGSCLIRVERNGRRRERQRRKSIVLYHRVEIVATG
jgi:hypothetical protein